MKRTLINCERCGRTIEIEPPKFGASERMEIEVRKPVSNSGEKLSAGIWHFCNEKCISEFFKE